MAIQYKVVEPDCGIKVTNVSMYAVCNKMYTKAIATVELNHALVLRDLRVMEGQFGLFVAYPIDINDKCEDVRNLVNPIDDNLRNYIEAVVLNKYNEMAGVIEAANQPVWVGELRA